MKTRYYSPRIDRFLVCDLYFEAKRRCKPMTRLTDELLLESLRGSESLDVARQRFGAGSDKSLTKGTRRNGELRATR